MGLKHQAASARKWRAAIRQVERHFPAHLPPIFFLTDPKRTPDPVTVVDNLPVKTGVIYRHFGASDRLPTALALADVCARRGLPLLIAADPKLAVQVGAAGVHWPEATVPRARKYHCQFDLQTASAHSPTAIRAAYKAGLDAALVSTVFASHSPSASSPLGALRFRAQTQSAPLPIYALGGVKGENAGKIASFAGLAAIEGLLS